MAARTNSGNSFFLSGLLLLFIGLKLTGYIDWSWWWVLSPIWIPILIGIVIGIVYATWKTVRP